MNGSYIQTTYDWHTGWLNHEYYKNIINNKTITDLRINIYDGELIQTVIRGTFLVSVVIAPIGLAGLVFVSWRKYKKEVKAGKRTGKEQSYIVYVRENIQKVKNNRKRTKTIGSIDKSLETIEEILKESE